VHEALEVTYGVVRERAGAKVSYDVTARVVTGLKHFSVVDIDLGRGGNRFGPTPALEPPRR